jgi:hypothetical protein
VQATRPKGDTRTRAQQQADALVQLADNALASGELPMLRTVKPQLIVTIALEDLLDPSTGPGASTTGCFAPTHRCDVHHLLEWIVGGETSLASSALLCERHHTKVHHGFRVDRPPDGRWRTHRPDGTEIAIAPRQ